MANEKLIDFIEKNFLDIHSPGYVIELFSDGQAKEFVIGNKRILPNVEKTTSDTLYDIASLTKTFTATLVFIAYESGLVDLNSSVYSIDSNFTNLRDTTILDLLCHNQEIYTDGYLGDVSSKEQFYAVLYSAYVKSTKPTYVDVDYVILSSILGKIYQKPFDELVDTMIIKKLGLESTTFRPNPSSCASSNYEDQDGSLVEDLSPGVVHDKKARKAAELGIYVGHAGLFSTGKDMMTFLETFFNHKLLTQETIELMLKHHNPDDYGNVNIYNFMGCRYKNDIKEKNDVPEALSDNSLTFSGYTGPMFVMDFDRHVIVLVLCNLLHNTHLDRLTRKNQTTKIIEFILSINEELLAK